MLRHLQAGLYADVGRGAPLTNVIGDPDPIAIKRVNDVVAFLVRAAGLDSTFKENLATMLSPVATDASAKALKLPAASSDGPPTSSDKEDDARTPRRGQRRGQTTVDQKSLPLSEEDS
jgi:hypothetical protein